MKWFKKKKTTPRSPYELRASSQLGSPCQTGECEQVPAFKDIEGKLHTTQNKCQKANDSIKIRRRKARELDQYAEWFPEIDMYRAHYYHERQGHLRDFVRRLIDKGYVIRKADATE